MRRGSQGPAQRKVHRRVSGGSPDNLDFSYSSALIAQILIIVGAAGAFAWLITTSGFPAKLIAFVDHLGLTTWMLLLVINVILLFVGSVLEPPAAILLLTPLLTPIVYLAGVDPIHFGIIVTVNLAGAFAWLITTSGFPAKLIAFVDHLGLTTWMLLLVINVILLFVGSVLEPPAAILLLTPLLTPIVYLAGV